MSIGLESIVADFNLCKLIPAGEFKYTAMVWRDDKIYHHVHLNCRTSDDMGYKGESEEVNYFPAPTLSEIRRELRNLSVNKIDGVLMLSCAINPDETFYETARDDNNVTTAALRLWLKMKGIEVTAPIIPDWCKTGALVYVTPDNREPFYGKVYGVVYYTMEVKVTLDGETVVGVFTWDNVRRARLRPWTYKEAIGKTVFWKFDNSKKEIASVIDRANDEGNVYVVGYGELKAEKLMMEERFSQSDGSPCGVLEHENGEGEWVE